MRSIFLFLTTLLALGAFAPGCAEDPVASGAPKVYVLPNPATYEALEEFAREFPNSSDPTGLRIVFGGLPDADCRITIHDGGGELVQEFDRVGGGSASWNLFTYYGREVPTGTYHWVVALNDDTVVGRGSVFISAERP